MARNLDIGALRSVVAVADAGGVTRAAERLHLTQSAVSMQIKRLEENLGLPLLERAGRGVSLTQEGEQLISYARRMLALNDEIWGRMTAPKYEGVVSLGVPHDIVHPHVPQILRHFDRDYPRVKVRLVSAFTSRLKAMMEQGELDVILTTEPSIGAGGETLATTPLLWYGAQEGRAWSRDPLPFATCRECVFKQVVVEALESVGRAWEAVADTNEDAVTMACVQADLAVMALLKGSEKGALAEVNHQGALPDLPVFHIGLYRARGDEAHLGAALADYVRAAYRGEVASERKARAAAAG